MAANRPALATWREGTERPDAMYHQPGQLAADTLLPVSQDIRTLGRLAGLEGSRHEEQGQLEEAWGWYKAMLRASRHVGRHGVLIERMIGAANFHDSAARICTGPRIRGRVQHSCAGHWLTRSRPTSCRYRSPRR